MRRYELMLVLRPDLADDKVQATSSEPPVPSPPAAARSSSRPRGAAAVWPIPSTTAAKGRTTSSCSRPRPTAIAELERGLLISEEVLRHLVTRVERPVRASRGHDAEADVDVDGEVSPPTDEIEEEEELIDEFESEAAPAAID